MRYIVVGGGILGLATARQLVISQADAEVVVLERESALAQHQTAHNSGVVHAGIYYAPGSLKARLCRRGLGLLRDFCRRRGLPYEACGKVVVAADERELEPLRRLQDRAAANGVPGLRWLEGGELASVEPHVGGVAGLHSPESAIADFASVARALADDVTAAGGLIRTDIAVGRVQTDAGRPAARLVDGTRIEADKVIVCAGLQVDRLAMASGEPAEPRIVPFRGEYWQLRPERAHLVRGLIYPVPDPALPFLGVHLTRKVDGTVVLGPNAILAVARYVPTVDPTDVLPAPAGVRAQAVDRDGSLVDDFRVSTHGNVTWVRNAPSPAATSSLAIAEELVTHAT